jgi:hypothetical protein
MFFGICTVALIVSLSVLPVPLSEYPLHSNLFIAPLCFIRTEGQASDQNSSHKAVATKHYATRHMLTSALVGVRDQLPGERAAGWVHSRAHLDDTEKRKFLIITGFEFRPLGLPPRIQSLYRLHYRSCLTFNLLK